MACHGGEKTQRSLFWKGHGGPSLTPKALRSISSGPLGSRRGRGILEKRLHILLVFLLCFLYLCSFDS